MCCRTIIEQELGRPVTDVFSYVNESPLATASIAQVHNFFRPVPMHAASITYAQSAEVVSGSARMHIFNNRMVDGGSERDRVDSSH